MNMFFNLLCKIKSDGYPIRELELQHFRKTDIAWEANFFGHFININSLHKLLYHPLLIKSSSSSPGHFRSKILLVFVIWAVN